MACGSMYPKEIAFGRRIEAIVEQYIDDAYQDSNRGVSSSTLSEGRNRVQERRAFLRRDDDAHARRKEKEGLGV